MANAAANELRAGTRLGASGRYVVGELINRGGTAVVYRGTDEETRHGVAFCALFPHRGAPWQPSLSPGARQHESPLPECGLGHMQCPPTGAHGQQK